MVKMALCRYRITAEIIPYFTIFMQKSQHSRNIFARLFQVNCLHLDPGTLNTVASLLCCRPMTHCASWPAVEEYYCHIMCTVSTVVSHVTYGEKKLIQWS